MVWFIESPLTIERLPPLYQLSFDSVQLSGMLIYKEEPISILTGGSHLHAAGYSFFIDVIMLLFMEVRRSIIRLISTCESNKV
jgi:hypothetical protein